MFYRLKLNRNFPGSTSGERPKPPGSVQIPVNEQSKQDAEDSLSENENEIGHKQDEVEVEFQQMNGNNDIEHANKLSVRCLFSINLCKYFKMYSFVKKIQLPKMNIVNRSLLRQTV